MVPLKSKALNKLDFFTKSKGIRGYSVENSCIYEIPDNEREEEKKDH